jgi:hypothetical protein
MEAVSSRGLRAFAPRREWRGAASVHAKRRTVEKPLALPIRRRDNESVEFGGDLDLTTKPRVGLHLISKIQHVFFLVGRFASQAYPFLIDIDMACRTGTATATFGGNLGDAVADGGLHNRRAFLSLDGPGFAA